MYHSTKVLVAAAVVAATLAAPPPATAQHADHPPTHSSDSASLTAVPSGADEVRAWNTVAMSTLGTAATPVPEQPLYLAYVHRAVLGAVRRTEHHRRASVQAAVATAAWVVLRTHFASQQSALDAAYDASLAALPKGSAIIRGSAFGRRAAARVLRERADDGRNGTPVPVAAAAPGVWQPAVPNVVGLSSWLGHVRPFVLDSPDALRPPPPPALTSARYARDFAEVRSTGSATSTTRTENQTEVARFWSDPPYVQNQRGLRDWSVVRHLSTRATAYLFAQADTAAADALISCWDAKYRYQLWRPVAAVPAADTDGNAATVADPGWVPLLGTPNHPEYPSAHSCATTALATVVAGLSRDGRLDLDLSSTTTGTTRHYGTVTDLISEVANARVWGGLHWRFSTVAGERIGRAVGHAVLRDGGRHH